MIPVMLTFQGMNMIAGMLIFHLDEETAFWGLVAILEMIMPTGYYSTDLLAARADQLIFQVREPRVRLFLILTY